MSTESTIDDLRELRDEIGITPSILSFADSLRRLISTLIAERENHPDVIPAAGDGAGKGPGRGLYAPWSDERAPQASTEVPTLGGPQIATDGLGDAIRRYARIFPNASPVVSGTLDAWAATADALEAERDRLTRWRAEAIDVLSRYETLARRVVPAARLGWRWSDLLAEHVDRQAAALAALDGEEL